MIGGRRILKNTSGSNVTWVTQRTTRLLQFWIRNEIKRCFNKYFYAVTLFDNSRKDTSGTVWTSRIITNCCYSSKMMTWERGTASVHRQPQLMRKITGSEACCYIMLVNFTSIWPQNNSYDSKKFKWPSDIGHLSAVFHWEQLPATDFTRSNKPFSFWILGSSLSGFNCITWYLIRMQLMIIPIIV